jgi:hypothetical protein
MAVEEFMKPPWQRFMELSWSAVVVLVVVSG